MKKENPFKTNTTKLDVLENRIEILMERVARLERDLTYHIMECVRDEKK